MKNLSITAPLLTLFLFSCGGSGGGNNTETTKGDAQVKLSGTSWEKECSTYNKFSSDELKDIWNVKIKLSIDSAMKSTYKTEYFHPTDTTCESILFNTLDISRLEVKDKVISEESIAARGLNETFIFNSESNDLPPNYTLIYINSEKLYFGQKSGINLGESPETRHSSISLDEYFIQIVN